MNTMRININISTLTGIKTTLRVAPSSTVKELKASIAPILGMPVSDQRLVYRAQVMHDELTLKNYGITDNAPVTLSDFDHEPDNKPCNVVETPRSKMDTSTRNINVNVCTLTGVKTIVQIMPSSTIGELKTMVAPIMDLPQAIQRMIFKNHLLHDGVTLDDYGIKDNATLTLSFLLSSYNPVTREQFVGKSVLKPWTAHDALTFFRERVM